ncbi:hypothetical protein [Pseudobacillus wudalianchiensis]|uniref:Lipoprotein n=1 Tax=Pseudobacillus wudalianchiensis TaxID=1743143 RepID=A0A1B9AMV8_9BACI|nr:hypothetical protein [Bacillus wudalianchiensis]OCA85263.1 hypothetical protein A8F95_11370 [Bacillus wudalianchiensis]
MGNLFKGCLGCLGLIILLLLVIGGCTAYFGAKEYNKTEESVTEAPAEKAPNSEDNETVSGKEETASEEKEAAEKGSWLSKIQEVAASNKSKTEKFDEVSLYAQDYNASDSERTEFENYIVNEYKNGKYLADIENDEYMLTNIFKAEVVDTYHDHRGQDNTPIALFAFDFWQNTKYTYRGVDDVNSHEVKANEEQMDKALAKMY